MFAGSSTSGNKSVTVQVLAPWNSTLPAYSNVRSEMNQISLLQFCACANSPMLYCCKNEENQCTGGDHIPQCSIMCTSDSNAAMFSQSLRRRLDIVFMHCYNSSCNFCILLVMGACDIVSCLNIKTNWVSYEVLTTVTLMQSIILMFTWPSTHSCKFLYWAHIQSLY